MADLRGCAAEIYRLEELAAGDSPVHRLPPRVKLVAAALFIIAVVSFDNYSFGRLAPYFLMLVAVTGAAGLPVGLIARRASLALPFCLFAGLANVFFDRREAFSFFSITVTCGMLSFAVIAAKALLCAAAAVLLSAVTPMARISAGLKGLRLPALFVTLFEMIYRYIGVMTAEASSRHTAWRLRGGGERGLSAREMGPLVGQLMIASADRAGRVYNAALCRGGLMRDDSAAVSSSFERRQMILCALPPLLFRVADIPAAIVNLFGRLL